MFEENKNMHQKQESPRIQSIFSKIDKSSEQGGVVDSVKKIQDLHMFH